MRIAVGTDHRGYALRGKIIELLERLGHEVEDMGTKTDEAVDYPDIAARVSRKVSQGEADRGILICGTGLGMCIAANKFPGVRAAPCHDDLTAEMSRRHNDSNVLCLSADLLGERLIDRMIQLWLTTPFEGGRHARRVEKISAIEREIEQQQAKIREPGEGLGRDKTGDVPISFDENGTVPFGLRVVSPKLKNQGPVPGTLGGRRSTGGFHSCWCGCIVRSGRRGMETMREGEFIRVRILECPRRSINMGS